MSTMQQAMRRLPNSTASWSCPWFWTIVWIAAFAALSGILAHSLAGTLVAVGAGLVIGREIGARRPDEIHCTPR